MKPNTDTPERNGDPAFCSVWLADGSPATTEEDAARVLRSLGCVLDPTCDSDPEAGCWSVFFSEDAAVRFASGWWRGESSEGGAEAENPDA